MKPVPNASVRARPRPSVMLLCGVAPLVALILLIAYVQALHVAVQRGEDLRRVQRAGGAMSSAGTSALGQPEPGSDAQANNRDGRVSRAVRAS